MSDYFNPTDPRHAAAVCGNPELLKLAQMIAERMKTKFGSYPLVSNPKGNPPGLVAYPTVPAREC